MKVTHFTFLRVCVRCRNAWPRTAFTIPHGYSRRCFICRDELRRRHWRAQHPKKPRHGARFRPTVQAIVKADPCAYCGGPGGSADHIVPIVSGGTGDWENAAGVCYRCGSMKGEKSMLTFLLERAA